MASFKDSAGRTWELASNTAAIKRVRSATGVSLGKISDGLYETYADAFLDLEKLTDVLYAWCAGQHPDVTAEAFAVEVMDGETIHEARRAMDEAFLLFFPSRQRQAMKAMAAELEEVAAQAQAMQFEGQKAKVAAGTETPSTTVTDSPA